ncbi:MAG: sigma-54-dependent Fis family transcriptional regulator [Desulfobulbaceae bacterium]|nr:sigma-54-dependent Fis family transcriptional regulator [Desulfobulbaceae bacterium]
MAAGIFSQGGVYVGNFGSILLVDADVVARAKLAASLRKQLGCIVVESDSPEQAFEIVRAGSVNILISTLFLPEKAGVELLKKVHGLDSQVITIAVVPEGERELAVEVMRLGVFFYVQSPYNHDEVAIVAARGMEFVGMAVPSVPPPKIRKSDGCCGLIGSSVKMREMFALLEKVAGDDGSTVLIRGESGTGKELVARAIHACSSRQSKNFVPINCAAIPGDLLESELFGFVKGAFTGAAQSKIGRVEYADHGTLFLDEIGDMTPNLQAKLLRVLQEREFEPLGGLKSVKVNIRVVAATHRDLEQLVAAGGFRADLYYRLNVFPLTIPPLRERREDIPLLIESFVRRFNDTRMIKQRGFDQTALDALQRYGWPGNVRELENLVQRMGIICEGRLVCDRDLPTQYIPEVSKECLSAPCVPLDSPEVIKAEAEVDFNSLISEFEDHLILQALAMSGGNKKEAARMLNLKRTTLLEKIKKKNLEEFDGTQSGRSCWKKSSRNDLMTWMTAAGADV